MISITIQLSVDEAAWLIRKAEEQYDPPSVVVIAILEAVRRGDPYEILSVYEGG